jgi:hypothetical protein
MILLFISLGRLIAVVAGGVLSLALSYHIIQIYYQSERHRKLQLFVMDIHFAIAIAYFARLLLYNHPMSFVFISFLFIRIIITSFEPFLMYVLTDERMKEVFR